MNKKQKGFSLIELLIVVAIILIIAAIAIPNLLRSRMAANEASAVGSIRTINTAAISYNSSYGNGFPSLLTEIGTTGTAAVSCNNAEYLDPLLTLGNQERLQLHDDGRRVGSSGSFGSGWLHHGRLHGRLCDSGRADNAGHDRAARLLLGRDRCDSL